MKDSAVNNLYMEGVKKKLQSHNYSGYNYLNMG